MPGQRFERWVGGWDDQRGDARADEAGTAGTTPDQNTAIDSASCDAPCTVSDGPMGGARDVSLGGASGEPGGQPGRRGTGRRGRHTSIGGGFWGARGQ